MTRGVRGWAPLAAIAALIAAGVCIDATGAFPLLRVAVNRTPSLLPSTLILPAAERDLGVSEVSLYVPNRDLYDLDAGLLTHRHSHGRDWERQGWISFFEAGRLTFSGSAGVRVHGGGSRYSAHPQSFRLFFRKQYGTPMLPAGVAFGGGHAHALKRLVLHNDMRPYLRDANRYHLTNPLAYDIARAMGTITPETRPVRFYLNGTFEGVYVLTEHFDVRDYFEPHNGRPAFMDDARLDGLWAEVQRIQPLRMRTMAPLVDIDNLTRWFIATAFCANRDPYQGPGQFYDPQRPGAPWFWVTWDMDQSFRTVDYDAFTELLEAPGVRRGRRANEPRPRILTTLLREDPEYREYFKARWVEMMNHVATPEFLRERFDHYAGIAGTLGVPETDYLPRVREFLERRPAILRTHAARFFGTGPMVRLQVAAPGQPVLVDGRSVTAGWEGYYFPGMTVRVEAATDPAATPRWRVNGREMDGAAATFAIDRDTLVDVAER